MTKYKFILGNENSKKVYKIFAKLTLILTISLFGIINSCKNQSQNYQTQQTNPSNLNLSNNNLNSSIKNTPSNTDAEKSLEDKEAKFGNYKYHYKQEGERTVALFTEKFLPRDDTIVVGAIRDVIKRAYKEDASGSPSLEIHGGFNKIHINSQKSDFYVNLIKQDTGDVHSLEIIREAK